MLVGTVKALIRLLRSEIIENVILSAGSVVEMAKLPAVILSGPLLNEKKRLHRDFERISVIDISEGKAVYEVPPRWYDLRFDVNISCSSNLELLELIEKFSRVNQLFPLIEAVSSERERKYSWSWQIMPGINTHPNISQVVQGYGGLTVHDTEIYSGIREFWPLIEKVRYELDAGKGTEYITTEG